ncbi:flagellin B [Helicobacter sp.]|uniref:flagellin B n=4 Tax=Helicobacter TaxID=209 RepID=UPI002A9209E4|nr:flagellin B [Helicobacter sp.]MDY5556244.1 flagellin B [Helicobacter sp.]
MAFQVNTNINALNAHAQSTFTQTSLSSSLQKLSSGLRINSAKDDASGMAIADNLRSQANTLGQAIRNTNDGMAIIQIADKAMDEQVKILDTIKTKATQAAQDGQTETTRKAIQADINRLVESLDNIAATTSYNGLSLLAGGFTNKEFQVGAYSNQTIRASIGATSSDKTGHVRTETYMQAGAAQFGTAGLSFTTMGVSRALESVVVSHSAGTGLGVLAEAINRYSDELGGVRAEADVRLTGDALSAAASLSGVTINGVNIGAISGAVANDADGRITKAINAFKDTTGVEASITRDGKLQLTSVDGRGITVDGLANAGVANGSYAGRLNLTQLGANDINVIGNMGGTTISTSMSASAVTTLRNIKGEFTMDQKNSIGVVSNAANEMGAGVTSLKGAMLVMDIAESAIKQLDTIRSDLGSVQQQMQSTINNITVTQVNVKSAESGIREVDFAQESANFSNLNILAQAGSYAMSQSNAAQQNILRLLQ